MKTIHIILFGVGNVGETLINQINKAKAQLNKQGIEVKIILAANSKVALFNDKGISNQWKTNFSNSAKPYTIDAILNFVNHRKWDNLIAIDATASVEFVQKYTYLIQNGFHLISANKVANTLDYEFYDRLRSTLKKYNKTFLYETNVGAGLPVIETVKNLYESGERINKIRGVFSGSLSYIFNTFSEDKIAFSEVLKKAAELGLTEPDARDDLSGKDVARKLLILARELNLNKEFNDVKVVSLVPKALNGKTTLSEFKNRIQELDKPLQELKQKLSKKTVLRYVGELDVTNETLEVKLISEDQESAIGQLKGADSVFEIYSESYNDSPLVIKGAGAGKEVTARGLFSDIIKLSSRL